jgi:hypothetical protein
LEFVMTYYYPILDHAPRGRGEREEAGSSGSAGTTSTSPREVLGGTLVR